MPHDRPYEKGELVVGRTKLTKKSLSLTKEACYSSQNLLGAEILTAETHTMKDVQILTWSAGNTTERGNSTERNPLMNMNESDSRGNASHRGTVKKGNAASLASPPASFEKKLWKLYNSFILFVCFQFKHTIRG